jgi:hypothetical protein
VLQKIDPIDGEIYSGQQKIPGKTAAREHKSKSLLTPARDGLTGCTLRRGPEGGEDDW